MVRFHCKSAQIWEDVRVMLSAYLGEGLYSYYNNRAEYIDYNTGFYYNLPMDLYTHVSGDGRIIAADPICQNHRWTYAIFKEMLCEVKKMYKDITISGGLRLSTNDRDRRIITYYSPSGSVEVEEKTGYYKETKKGHRYSRITNSWFDYTYKTVHGDYWICLETVEKAVAIIEKTDMESLVELYREYCRWLYAQNEWDFFEYKSYCDEYWNDLWPVYADPKDFYTALIKRIKQSKAARRSVKEKRMEKQIAEVEECLQNLNQIVFKTGCSIKKTNKTDCLPRNEEQNIMNVRGTKEEVKKLLNPEFDAERAEGEEQGSEQPYLGFIKMYIDQDRKKRLMEDFLELYNKLHIEYESMIDRYYDDCQIEFMPTGISRSCFKEEEDGLCVDFGLLSMSAYGSSVPDIEEYNVPEETIRLLLRKHYDFQYEGIVGKRNDWDYTIGYTVIGNVRDYSYTRNKVLSSL